MTSKMILATLDGASASERLVVSLVQTGCGELAFELRQQHHAEGIGWFDQRTFDVSPQQLRQIQGLLNLRSTHLAEAAEPPRATIPFPTPSAIAEERATGSDGR